MIVVADTSPINYLVRIGMANLLAGLYGEVFVPAAVVCELRSKKAPAEVRSWIEHAPSWVRIVEDFELLDDLAFLDAGEHQAISLAVALRADLLLIDERLGRREAQRLNIEVTGTLGVLKAGAEAGLIDLPDALEKLARTNFHISAKVVRFLLSLE